MEPHASEFDRLLRAAGSAYSQAAEPAEVPFGFDTRVVAAWRNRSTSASFAEISRWLRRVALTAACVAAIASAGAYWELGEAEDLTSPLVAADSIGDSAIEAGALQ